jgi:hypothetical protein
MAERRDHLGETALCDHQPRPQIGQELILRQELTRALDEIDQGLDDLGLDGARVGFSLREEQTAARIESELTELVHDMRRRPVRGVHPACHELSHYGRLRLTAT